MPYYRLIISEKRKDTFGNYLELLGNYNPRSKELNLKTERIKYWVSKGAQCSNTVHNMLVREGIIEEKKRKSVRISQRRKAKLAGKKDRVVAELKPGAAGKEPATAAPQTEAPKPQELKKEEAPAEDKE